MYVTGQKPTGIIPFVPFLGTDTETFDWKPLVFLAAGAGLAYWLLGGKPSRKKRSYTLGELPEAKYEVWANGRVSKHTSEYSAKKEAQRIARRGLSVKVKEI